VPTHYKTLPIPAFPQYTRMFEAGPVTFGVEYRLLNEKMIRDAYGENAREQFDNTLPPTLTGTIDEDGVSVHVFGSQDHLEYLRFDCFADFPHYHYITAREGHQTVMDFDAIADGPILSWTLGCLRSRLPAMLTRSGAPDLAEKLDRTQLDRVLDEVGDEIKAAVTRGKPTRFDAD